MKKFLDEKQIFGILEKTKKPSQDKVLEVLNKVQKKKGHIR